MNIILGEYIKKESILHQLDPRTKIIGSFSFILSFLFINTFIGYVITGILILILIFLSKIPLKEFLKSLKYLLYILIFSSIFHILSHQDGKLLFQLSKFSIYDSGIFSALKMIFRIVFLLIFSSLLTLTTKPLDIALGLELPECISFLNKLNQKLKNPIKISGDIKEESILLSIRERLK